MKPHSITTSAHYPSQFSPTDSPEEALFKAVEDGRIKSLDEKAVRWERRLQQINEQLDFKDAEIAWRHFANQTSCYQLVEKPGAAFDYNDWQMALFWDTLFLKVYGTYIHCGLDVDSAR